MEQILINLIAGALGGVGVGPTQPSGAMAGGSSPNTTQGVRGTQRDLPDLSHSSFDGTVPIWSYSPRPREQQSGAGRVVAPARSPRHAGIGAHASTWRPEEPEAWGQGHGSLALCATSMLVLHRAPVLVYKLPKRMHRLVREQLTNLALTTYSA